MALSRIEMNAIKDVNDAWNKYLKPTIEDVKSRIEGNASSTTKFSVNHFMRFTGIVQHLCQTLASTGDVSAKALKVFEDNCTKDINGLLKSLKDGPYLSELARRWEKYKIFVKIACALFQYLDVHHFNFEQPTGSNKEKRIRNLQKRAYDVFREQVFIKQKQDIQRLTLHFIDRERAGEAVDNAMLKNVVDLYVLLDPTLVFYNSLEMEFLQRARYYYQQLAKKSIDQDTAPEYMIKCETAFGLESQRVGNYMNVLTQKKIREVLDDELLRKYARRLINMKESGFLALVEQDKIEDLARMYRLMTHLDNALGIDLMATDFKTHIQSVGENLMLTQDVLPEKTSGKKGGIRGFNDDDDDDEERAITAKKKKKKKKGEMIVDAEEGGDQERVVTAKKKKKKKGLMLRDDEDDGDGITAPVNEDGEVGADLRGGGQQTEQEALSQVSTFVDQVLTLYRRYNRMYVESFQNFTKFNAAIKDAFTEFLNRTPEEGKRVFAELLAVYVDELMKSKAATALDEQISTRFDEIVGVLGYIHNKDIFSNRNDYLLSRRILDQGSETMIQEEAEKAFIVKLKQSMGDVFTSKQEGMFRDHAQQIELQTRFRDHLMNKNVDLGLELQVQVLTMSNWPKFTSDKVTVPDNLLQALKAFEQFYNESKPGQMLEWVHSCGSMGVDVKTVARLLIVSPCAPPANF
ncbi:MAG: putative Cullin 1 [Streblomastix strix]|uniref:Putative Cullin 1 n=1 Tax=Streblomastix strix TaxID=222440 RepID=A0A5J4W572_9EUKA|nr:MAG: putative Cullin 1 [Streblomastix strix]